MKNRQFQLYLLGLLVLFGIYIAVDYYRPKPADRTQTFINRDKIPYGTYALYDLLPDLLRDSVQTVREPIFNQLTAWKEKQSDRNSGKANASRAAVSYVFIQPTFRLDSLDAHALLRFVAQGNDVFIAAEEFDRDLRDTLHFDTAEALSFRPRFRTGSQSDSIAVRPDSVTLRFQTLGLAPLRRFRYPATLAATRFVTDSLPPGATVLASDERRRPVLVRVAHGGGHFYLCSVPIAFTNVFVLRPQTSDFAFASLSHLPADRPAWWDEYQKQGRLGGKSLLGVLLRYPALRAAFYLTCIGSLLFIFFEAKRRQRIIPILKPLPNTTLLFTRTVAALYRQGNDHTQLADKKINLFLEYLRTRFHEPELDLNDEHFRDRLAHKSGVTREGIDKLLRLINFTRTAPQVSDQQLLQLSHAISEFRRMSR
ncbi:DUF4350 domain-containing protein [Hymenobacter sp. HDW8]|uniref:DUF4350 domain-containing protein n=1 Tax=Hymenobacter sp. HDW8 TaxID=2714932 RepID=UPI0014077EC1|nr:DUF4350 domain-containing protein [Hymenobacter sp. HDW8]QIL75624.1 DUF4350 domain-containing protein [Hymenobacter sp. HDW8]